MEDGPPAVPADRRDGPDDCSRYVSDVSAVKAQGHGVVVSDIGTLDGVYMRLIAGTSLHRVSASFAMAARNLPTARQPSYVPKVLLPATSAARTGFSRKQVSQPRNEHPLKRVSKGRVIEIRTVRGSPIDHIVSHAHHDFIAYKHDGEVRRESMVDAREIVKSDVGLHALREIDVVLHVALIARGNLFQYLACTALMTPMPVV